MLVAYPLAEVMPMRVQPNSDTRPTAPLATAPVPVAARGVRRGWSTTRAQASDATSFAMPTHPIHGALRRGLLVPTAREEVVRVRTQDRQRRLKVRMGFTRPDVTGAPVRPAGAGLLKTHLDLVDLASRADAPDASLPYDLSAALARLGFVRLASGGYHPTTVREHVRRLQALSERAIALEGRAAEPLWRFYAAGPDAALTLLTTPAEWEAARRAGTFLARPGAWLAACEMADNEVPVDRGLLALPIDGHGHQVERLALLLAAELASVAKGEPGDKKTEVKRTVGGLLARAGVAELDGLRAETAAKGNGPKRLRQYLAGEGFADEGALALLRDRAGFDVDIHDEAAFWAAGRGWVDRFWEARVKVGVPGAEQPLATFPVPTAATVWLPDEAV